MYLYSTTCVGRALDGVKAVRNRFAQRKVGDVLLGLAYCARSVCSVTLQNYPNRLEQYGDVVPE